MYCKFIIFDELIRIIFVVVPICGACTKVGNIHRQQPSLPPEHPDFVHDFLTIGLLHN